MMTEHQGDKLADLIHELRPDWDQRGISVALIKAQGRGTAFELSIAAIAAAQVSTNRTPAVIAMDGAHWHTRDVPTADYGTSIQITGRCDDCGGLHPPGTEHDPPEHRRSTSRAHSAIRAWDARAALRKDTP